MKKLKRCPFCGGEASVIDDDGSKGKVYSVYHQCPRDGGRFNRYGSVCSLTIDTGWYDTLEKAIQVWNTRAYIEDYATEAGIRVMNDLAEQLEKARTKLGSGE